MIALLLCVLLLGAAEPSSAADAPDAKELLRSTLLYGIDSQVLETIGRLKNLKDSSMSADLVTVLAESPNPEIRKAIFDLFADQGAPDGLEVARSILAGWQDQGEEILIAAMRYMEALSAPNSANLLVPLVSSPDNAVATKAIDALGKTGDRSATKLLLDKYASTDFPDSLKPGLLLALGNLKDPVSVEPLLAVARDTSVETQRRCYAADALGKIGDPKALPVLKGMLAEKDALIRSYAISALASFDVSQVMTEILQGLKDENWRVRLLCTKALARELSAGDLARAVPILRFKAEWDPVSQIRLEAIKTLGTIGGESATGFLFSLFRKTTNPLEIREAALTTLAAKGLTAIQIDGIKAAIKEDTAAHNPRAVLSTAKVLSTARSEGLQDMLGELLASADPFMRLYGIRGIALNGLSSLKGKLVEMAEKDPSDSVQREARKAAEKL